MIRPFTCVCLLLAGGSGLYVYQEKHRAHLLEIEIAKTIKQVDAARARTAMLRAEWALLNEPDRLQDLADRHLQLQTMVPSQFVQMSELDQHLPAPLAPGSAPASGPVEEPSSVPVAQGGEAGGDAVPVQVAAARPGGLSPSRMTDTPSSRVANVAPARGGSPTPPARVSEVVASARVPDPAPAPAPARAATSAPAEHRVAAAEHRPVAPHPADRRIVVARRAPEPRHDAAPDQQIPAPAVGAPVVSAYAPPGSVLPIYRRAPVVQRAAALSPPQTTSEAIARIARGGAFDPSVPAVASALGAARSMMAPPPVPIASAEAATLPRMR
jgi:hypothetical protein